MSRFYDWAQDLYDRKIVDYNSLAELECLTCPKDYIFEEDVQAALFALEKVDPYLLTQVALNKQEDRIISSYIKRLPIRLEGYIGGANLFWAGIRNRLLEKELFQDVRIVDIVKEDFTCGPCYVVLHHYEFDEYIKVEGYYTSYKGTNYTSFKETRLVEKKQVVYEYE
jgi:hypothetical protein